MSIDGNGYLNSELGADGRLKAGKRNTRRVLPSVDPTPVPPTSQHCVVAEMILIPNVLDRPINIGKCQVGMVIGQLQIVGAGSLTTSDGGYVLYF